MGNDSIDKSSAEYLFAQVITQLAAGDKSFKELKAQLANVNTKQIEIGASIKALPCNQRMELLNQLKQWQDDYDAHTEVERVRHEEHSVTLRQAIIIIGVTAIITSLCGYVLQVVSVTANIAAGR